ncbi:MAG: hypothetical protein ACRCVI_01170 [Mycoplasmoidaceae bacterium]
MKKTNKKPPMKQEQESALTKKKIDKKTLDLIGILLFSIFFIFLGVIVGGLIFIFV